MDGFDGVDNRSYGQLLGEYFRVVATIGAMETEFCQRKLQRNQAYLRLIAARREIRRLLDTVVQRYSDSDIKDALDEAFVDR